MSDDRGGRERLARAVFIAGMAFVGLVLIAGAFQAIDLVLRARAT